MASIITHEEVAEALSAGRPVVALETAVVTHGLPRESTAGPWEEIDGEWDAGKPLNLALAMAMQRRVRKAGAVPATVSVIDGKLRIGMDEEDLRLLAADETASKGSVSNLADVLAGGANGGTTVSATLAACARAEPAPIRVLATGGIGGVHARWTERPDISADLGQLSATRTCVVCAGAKSVLDLPATVEALETLGVPLVGYRTDWFPCFHAVGSEQLKVPQRVDDAQQAAALCRSHWDTLGFPSGILLANPIEPTFAMGNEELDAAVLRANEAAEQMGVMGAELTPFLLSELARITDGRSLMANISLLLHNAQVAAEVAGAIAGRAGM